MKCKLVWIADKTFYGYDEQEIVAKSLKHDTDWEEIDGNDYIKLVGFINNYNKSKYGERLYLIRLPNEHDITLPKTVSAFLEHEKTEEEKRKKREAAYEKERAEKKKKSALKRLEKLKKEVEKLESNG